MMSKRLVCIYPYKKTWSRELEYSIKSLKNVPHDGVYLIGDKPDYDVPATIIAPEPHQTPHSPYIDVFMKHYTACLEIDTEWLLAMADDVFLLEPYDFTMYDRGSMTEHIAERRRNDAYKTMLQNTYDYLVANGETTKDYTTHTPFLYRRKNLLALINQVMPEIKCGKAMSIRTLYGNIYNVPSETIKDVKNPDVYEGLPILSTNEHTFTGQLGKYIRERINATTL